MFERISGMPTGTFGFEAVGKVDDDDVEDTVGPVLRNHIAQGGKVRVLYLLGPRMRKYEADAFGEEVRSVARHPSAYEKVAVVTDEEWLRPALRLLSVLAPGQIRGFPVSALEAAKSWLAEGFEERGRPLTTPSGSPHG
ncbi:SpoIIAA-like protein [Pseudonocardia hierapolitana]|uniref:SpoIIAA-like protein n=1 Tax=Pseudonocardia hierapolitana TaxID=1128676 RepID=A0A561SKT3_9PSEU|nr:STAS/SEC14 domain-containing protein [Pseudonocardia hierapolitana]TWF75475.1 SpoIIAA-like protein [Pseudonocardia hierapolitana]